MSFIRYVIQVGMLATEQFVELEECPTKLCHSISKLENLRLFKLKNVPHNSLLKDFIRTKDI